jgi:glycosyltransferase involved in cell wall biosynthesis
MLGVPIVLHLHGSGFDQFYEGLSRRHQGFVQGMFRRATGIVVCGEGWRRFLIDRIGVDPSKVSVMYNGVPEPRARRRVRGPNEPAHIVMLGRLAARKGVPELLKAFGSDALRGRRWRATLAGDGEVEATRAAAEAMGLGDRITTPGWVGAAEASALLSDADVLVLPSHAENMPLSVLEGLAHGVAVLTTPVGTTPEILTDGVSALLVPPGDVTALTAALARLIDDPAERERIAEAGHQVYLTHLEVNRAADRLAALYRKLNPRLFDDSADRRAAHVPKHPIKLET